MELESKYTSRKEKLKAVAAEVMRPENAPPGHIVKTILARGGLRTTVTKVVEK